MEKVEVEVYSHASNLSVIRLPGRKSPGTVIQGDSLNILYRLATSILSRAKVIGDIELVDEASELTDLLVGRIKLYESVLQEHGIELPYHPANKPE
jgi:hypothetical protein